MGRKLDALLGRNFRTSKFKNLAKLAISRIAILKKQRQVRCSHARSDVLQLLNLGHQDRALSRVEQVIEEQNMLDAFVMIENYCHILIERVVLFQKNKECSDELKEAISSLIFASSRCGEFPELQHIREIFVSKFGKDFTDGSVNLRKNCGVNPKMIQKLARQPSLESRFKILKEIASENGITLNLEEYVPEVTKEKLNVNQKQQHPEPNYYSASLDNSVIRDDTSDLPKKLDLDELSESIKEMKYYRDAAAAAQDAFESAAYAAAAARAAVELSRSESRDNDPDDCGGSSPQQGTIYDSGESSTPKLQRDEYSVSQDIKDSNDILGFVKVHPIENFDSESEGEDIAEDSGKVHLKGMEDSKSNAEIERTVSVSSSDSGDILIERKLSNDLGCDRKPSLPTNEYQSIRQHDTVDEENLSNEDGNKFLYPSPKWIPLKSQADRMIKPMVGEPRLTSTHSLNTVEQSHSQHSNTDRKWASMRTRRAPGV